MTSAELYGLARLMLSNRVHDCAMMHGHGDVRNTHTPPYTQRDIQPAARYQMDFASRFPPRQLEAKILEVAIGTIKIESGACDLPPEGSKERVGRSTSNHQLTSEKKIKEPISIRMRIRVQAQQGNQNSSSDHNDRSQRTSIEHRCA